MKKSKKRICQKCAHPNKARVRRCESCDWDLSKEPISSTTKIIYVTLIFLIILLPTRVEKYQEEVPYLKTIHSTEQVPYDKIQEEVIQVPYKETETYIKKVSYRDKEYYQEEVCSKVDISYITEWEECYSGSWFSSGESTIKISNTDSVGGTFVVRIGYKDVNNAFVYETISKYINSGSTGLFSNFNVPSSINQCYHQKESVPEKDSCHMEQRSKWVDKCCKDEIRTRQVTKYKSETKYNTITDYRLEKKQTQVMKTRNETNLREVNWLFGFDALIKFKTKD